MRPISFVPTASAKFRYAGLLLMIAAAVVLIIELLSTPDTPKPSTAVAVPQARQSTPATPIPANATPEKPVTQKAKPTTKPVVAKRKANAAKPAAPKTTGAPIKPAIKPAVVKTTGAPGQIAASFAKAQVGKPYTWGGAGPAAFDCSGLVMRAWQAAGVELPHRAADQWHTGVHVDRAQMQPGDLVLTSGLRHVQMYIGDGKVVEAPHPGASVRITALPTHGIAGYVRPAGGKPAKPVSPEPNKAIVPVANPVPVTQTVKTPAPANTTPVRAAAPVKPAPVTTARPVARHKGHTPIADRHHLCPLNHRTPKPLQGKPSCTHAHHVPDHGHRSTT
jgi:cell wall-associated NlpC family hydrolase